MLLVYTHRITSRSKYVFKLILGDILKLKYELSTNKEEFLAYQGPKFSYARHPVGDELFFYATGLLFETGIVVQELSYIHWNGNPAFYTTIRNSALPFDPFAASFYLSSRYEEYLPHIKDVHGRFAASQSVAYRNHFLQKPLINIWAREIASLLKKHFPGLEIPKKEYRYIPTIDIDNAWAYRHKGFIRVGAGLIADLINLNFRHFSERIKVLLRLKEDPYDTYDYQVELIERYNLQPIYFFLLGDYAPYDKNVPYQNKHLQSLIKFIDDFAQVGIHPSYASNDKPASLKREISRLSAILHREIQSSRQHFLRMSLPETYQRLIEMDITDDYTMGYAEQPGFRASLCSPFFFYDLDLEIETSLRVHPFCIMDGTLKDYLKVEPEGVIDYVRPLIDEVRNVGGNFITIWHNESFAENERWRNWRKVYEDIIEAAV